ncbi:hypothetical protein [Curtobacterium poinsettiae]|uniref:hypothetical protein n=1 Tax=Curtobacterium poinsettiae TaxID=159612 RepID=UPI001BDF144B|nr:hypothetical protein [Curtobacterium flaccumfaciens]MBT1611877.1 hypothetical protein [Curtobacterium flaccumfaciens pv. poinsettiae]
MTAHPAVVLTCDTTDCEQMLAVTGPFADSYGRARAYAETFGWVTADWDNDWCPACGARLGGRGLPLPYGAHLVDGD